MLVKLTFFLLIVGSCPAIAQQKFIEVTISDTVLARANLFIYKIVMSADNFDEEEILKGRQSMVERNELRHGKTTRRFDSLTSRLRSEGFMLAKSSLGDSVNFYGRENMLFSTTVVVHSVDSLTLLYRQLRDQKNLTGVLAMAVATDETSYQKRLFSKILADARTKAENIAVGTNQQIREVLSVVENKPDEVGGWTSYPPLSALTDIVPGWHTTIKTSPVFLITDPRNLDLYSLSTKVTIRFSVE